MRKVSFGNVYKCQGSLVVLTNVVSFSEISAVNLIVGWKLLACSMNR